MTAGESDIEEKGLLKLNVVYLTKQPQQSVYWILDLGNEATRSAYLPLRVQFVSIVTPVSGLRALFIRKNVAIKQY